MSTNELEGENSNSKDLGGRIIWDSEGRLGLSGEVLGRWFSSSSPLEDTWRATVIADYDVGSNKTLSFSFGRDFEGGLTGNLVAAVQFIMGFGAKRLNLDGS